MITDTPVQEYKLKGKKVLVKRDDLMGDGNTLPPWGKLAGIDRLLHRYINPKYPLIHLAVNGSWSGWALSHLCKQRDIKFVYAYPPSKTYSKFILNKAKENGCEFYELKPNMMAILYAQVQSYAKRKDIQMLPYAFDHIYYRNCMASKARNVFEEYPFIDHLVISAGSGVTSSGVVKQFNPGTNLFSNSNRQAHVITVSNVSTIEKKFAEYGMADSSIHVHKTKFLFEDMMKNYEVPFPCNGTWDRKAWWWLEQNIEQLEGDILFWNIGGNV